VRSIVEAQLPSVFSVCIGSENARYLGIMGVAYLSNAPQLKLLVTAVITAGDQVLLVRYRKGPDGQGGWVVPTDDVRNDEHPVEAVRRILRDQLSLDRTDPKIKDVDAFVGNDGTRHIPLHFHINVSGADQVHAKGELDARWFPVSALPPAKEQAFGGWSDSIIKSVLSS
jgi:ADP-ribose pyrophosphatase YjhB (NUDIX family)